MKKLSEQSYSELMLTIQQEVEKIESVSIDLLSFDVRDPDDIIDYLQGNNKKSNLRCKIVHRCRDDYESTAKIMLYYIDSPQDKVYLDYDGSYHETGDECKLVWKTPTKVNPIEIKSIRWESVSW